MSTFTDKPISPEDAIDWLEGCADYFEKEAIGTENDRAYWAYRTNADTCKRIKELIEENIVNE